MTEIEKLTAYAVNLTGAAALVIDMGGHLDCSCSVRERDSGHRSDCYVPEMRVALDGLSAVLAQGYPGSGDPKAGNDARACTCHPDDNPPKPCPRKFALEECRAAAKSLDGVFTDTQRLDWLEAQGQGADGADAAWWVGGDDGQTRFNLKTSPCVYTGDNLRETIDYAIQQYSQGKTQP